MWEACAQKQPHLRDSRVPERGVVGGVSCHRQLMWVRAQSREELLYRLGDHEARFSVVGGALTRGRGLEKMTAEAVGKRTGKQRLWSPWA